MVARQHQLTSEVVGAKVEGTPLEAANRDMTRPLLLLAAAGAAVARRQAFEALRQQRASAGQAATFDASAVRKGAFVGQVTSRRADTSRYRSC